MADISRIDFSYDCCRPNSKLIRASTVKDKQTELHCCSRDCDVHCTQAALCLFDLEAHGLTLVEQADVRGQVRAMDENVPGIVIAREKAVALSFVKEFDFSLTVTCSPSDVMTEFLLIGRSLGRLRCDNPSSHAARRMRRIRVPLIATRLCWSQSRDGFCGMCERREARRAQFCKARLRARQCRKKYPAVKPQRRGFVRNTPYHVDHATKFFLS